MRLVLLQFSVFISSVICINENDNSDQSAVRGRYNFNHPPSVEEYNPIPVAVVYEDDVTVGKSLNPEIKEDPTPDANIEEVSPISKVEKPLDNSEHTEPSTVIPKSTTDYKQDDISVRPKARALSELQIPVAVIYDSVPDSIQKRQETKANETTIPKRRHKQVRRRKLQQNKNNTELIKPEFQNIESTASPQRRIEPVQTQPQKIESIRQNPLRFENTNAIGKKPRRERDPVVPIIDSQNYVFSHSGNFHYSYESGDGTKAHSEGELRSVDDEAAGEAVSGGFSYTDKEGNDFSLSYTADENGYRPVGAHLPTPPPIPPAIARALAYLATATTPEPVTKPTTKRT